MSTSMSYLLNQNINAFTTIVSTQQNAKAKSSEQSLIISRVMILVQQQHEINDITAMCPHYPRRIKT